MEQKKQNWIDDFKTDVGKKISKAWFLTFSNTKGISNFLYENEIDYRNWQMKKVKKLKKETTIDSVKKRFTEWKKLGFFEQSKTIEQKTWRRGYWYYPKTKLYRLNLNPLYLYCKEKHNKSFTDEEKKFLEFHFKLGGISKYVFFEFPQEDIFNSIIKFYVKHYVMPYTFMTRLHREKNKNIKEFERKAKEMNQRKKEFLKLSKQEPTKGMGDGDFTSVDKIMEKVNKKQEAKVYDYIDAIVFSSDNSLEDGLKHYLTSREENPDLILSIDTKFLQALGIMPD